MNRFSTSMTRSTARRSLLLTVMVFVVLLTLQQAPTTAFVLLPSTLRTAATSSASPVTSTKTTIFPRQQQQQQQQRPTQLSLALPSLSFDIDSLVSQLSVLSNPTLVRQQLAAISAGDYADRSTLVLPLAAAAAAVSLAVSNLLPKQALVNENQLASLLEGTFLNKSLQAGTLQCFYKASRDGWSAIDFHKAVDGQGSALVVIQTRSGKTVGGFNPTGWRSTDDYYSSSAAFLWCLSGNSNAICKFPTLPGGSAAVFDYATAGPCFGADDLQVGPPQAAIMGGFAGPDAEDLSKSAGNLKTGKSSLGGAYTFDDRWPVRGAFAVVELEVYCNEF